MKTWTLRLTLWSIPLLMLAQPAHAWGLYTHTYFAQLLLTAVPLSEPAFRLAARHFPRLVMAGASLPDLALLAGWLKTPAFRHSHEWPLLQQMLRSERTEHQAIALGFASHLLVDVIAHHHFVPEHEHRWFDWPVVTHALCEWAMDRHLQPELRARPGELLQRERTTLAPFVSQHFGCDTQTADRALRQLASADQGLRRGRLPGLIYRASQRLDSRLRQRFEDYLQATARHLPDINRLIAGHTPLLHANGSSSPNPQKRDANLLPGSLFVQLVTADMR